MQTNKQQLVNRAGKREKNEIKTSTFLVTFLNTIDFQNLVSALLLVYKHQLHNLRIFTRIKKKILVYTRYLQIKTTPTVSFRTI